MTPETTSSTSGGSKPHTSTSAHPSSTTAARIERCPTRLLTDRSLREKAQHGLGREERKYFLELEEPAKIILLSRIQATFDPNHILNPGVAFSPNELKSGAQGPGSA
ncbi:MAG: hypothetical protein JRH01_22785 [Deltaproteobacteria bacterium]|nr:hypothetical protein [Deltaproteobacteria bacterium]MBW2396799.1 hypothetical protein [Deltaproteobacteria bacterium]